MESEPAPPSTGDAARLLQRHDETRDRVEQRTPSRAFASFMLWGAAVIAVSVGVFLLSFDPQPPDEVAAGAGASTPLLIIPILIFSSLVSGARERFGVRTRPSPGYWIAVGVILAGVLGLQVSIIAGLVYPWWLNLLLPTALFAVMAAGPIRQLRRARTPEEERWTSEPLNQPARSTTTLIGVVLGTVAATSTQPWSPLVQMAIVALIVVALIGYRSRWGLPRTGFEWGPIHWAAFGITVGILFLLTALLTRTDWIDTWVAVALGVVAAAVMVLTSLLPARTRRG